MFRVRSWIVIGFLAPAAVGLLVFRIYPIAITVWESLFRTTYGATAGTHFVALANYSSIFTDPTFWRSLWVTLKFNAIINPLQIALALGLAVLAARSIRGIVVYRILFLIPVGVSLPIAVIIWQIMLAPNNGFINAILATIGLPQQPFLTSTKQALASIIAIASWKGISYWMIFLLAGIQGIPAELYEAAMLDGAGPFQRFLRVTLPLLRRPLLFVLVADISVNFLLFAPVFMLTQGGPANSTDVLMYEAYKTGFVFGEMGRAMAIVMVLVVLVILTVLPQFRLAGNAEARP